MKYVALLRGINVGGRTIKSAALKSCFDNAGFKNSQTVLATGNVIIDSTETPAALKVAIEHLLEQTFHFPVQVCLVSVKKLTRIIMDYPFMDAGPEFHKYVIFKDQSLEALEIPAPSLDDKLEAVLPGDGVVYWRVLKGRTLDSDFAKALARASTKSFSTTRNLNTLEKILHKAQTI